LGADVKNLLDSLWGSVACGLALTVVLYLLLTRLSG
jgi:hypothetical protein